MITIAFQCEYAKIRSFRKHWCTMTDLFIYWIALHLNVALHSYDYIFLNENNEVSRLLSSLIVMYENLLSRENISTSDSTSKLHTNVLMGSSAILQHTSLHPQKNNLKLSCSPSMIRKLSRVHNASRRRASRSATIEKKDLDLRL